MKASAYLTTLALVFAFQASQPEAISAPKSKETVDTLYAKAKASKSRSSAIRFLTRALSKNHKCGKCLKMRGALYMSQGEYLSAAIDLQNYLKQFPKDYKSTVRLGICYRWLNKKDLAIRTYAKAIKLKPQESWAYATTANIYQDKRNYRRSIYYTNKALKLKPNNAILYSNRAGVYRWMGKYDLALKDAKKAIELAPKNPSVYVALAATYYDLGYYKKAAEIQKMIVKKRPRRVSYWNDYATILMRAKMYKESISACNKALYLNKRSSNAYKIRGAVYSSLGEDKQALKDLDKSLELDPENSATYGYRAALLTKLGHYEQATQDYESARKTSVKRIAKKRKPDAPTRSSLKQILSLYSKSIESNPKDMEAYYNRAIIHFSMGNYKKAYGDFKIYSKNPKASKNTLFHSLVYMILLDRLNKVPDTNDIARLKSISSGSRLALSKYFRGGLTSKQVLESTSKSLSETLVRFVIAVNEYSKNHKEAALGNLKWINRSGDDSRDEYMMALCMLEKIVGHI